VSSSHYYFAISNSFDFIADSCLFFVLRRKFWQACVLAVLGLVAGAFGSAEHVWGAILCGVCGIMTYCTKTLIVKTIHSNSTTCNYIQNFKINN
jgi:hypothetical protein